MKELLPGLESIDFRYFTYLVITLLGGAGTILAFCFLFKRTRPFARSSWKAYRSWLIMVPIGLLVIGIGGKLFIGALFLLSIFCIKEFTRATGLYEDWRFIAVIYLGCLALYLTVWIRSYGLFVAMPAYIIAVILMIPPLCNQYKNMIQKIGLSAISVIYLSFFPAQLAFLAHHPSSFAYLAFYFIGIELNDISAYICGKLFGKHLLVSKISPKKTVEGAVGSFIIVSLYIWGVHQWVPRFNFLLCFLSLLIFCVGGIFGDLVMSFFKRDIGIKDMGRLIPGHGGLLDRVDSLLFTSPFYFHMINYFIKFPGGLF